MVTLEDIKEARKSLKGVVKRTELTHSNTFSNLTENQVYLKMENLQRTGSFKVRGAYNKIANLSQEERTKGVVAASAGNHAQGVALASSSAGIESTIIMPKGAPIAKVKATQGYGAKVILSGTTYDDAHTKEKEYAQRTGATIIPAFNDPYIIAGQGTIGLEILEDLDDIDVIIAPIGGGGLLAGIATAVKEVRSDIEVIGVEAENAASMKESLRAGKPIGIKDANTIADGIAVKCPGSLNYPILEKYLDGLVTVNDEEIAHTILLLLERAKLMVEGAGATALAALLNGKLNFKGKKVGVVLSGGNIDLDMIAAIIDRGMIQAGRRLVFSTHIDDTPGSLQNLLGIIGRSGANIVSVEHDRLNPDISLKEAEVRITLETRDEKHIEKVVGDIIEGGYSVTRVR
ncbi:threonine ammonia-lyase [Halonatronum saccharophilum]|uniref:threonine ammonia-lyase n=1 Tax=Halonatronum saccharophilum TaxID=150060 RepID=UPI0004800809|nr:threonine ammonia-lyase [Halonatronum saccharophilum]